MDMVETAAGLRALLPQGGALIGLDLGTKTIGTAFCDAQWTFATPARTIKRRKFLADREELRLAIESRDARGIVLGLPRNLDGTEGPRCQSTRAFARNIADLALPILLWDERWSTQAVERAMIEQDVSRGKRAERIDSAAAAYILQGAIDALVRD